MTRACFIGNSHLGSVRLAWPLVRDDFPGLDVTFFGAPGKSLGELQIRDGVVGTASKRAAQLLQRISGRGEFRIADFDYFALFGIGFSPSTVLTTFENFGVWRAGIEDPEKRLLSRPAFVETVAGQLRRSLAATLGAKLRAETDRPIFIVPQPCPAEGVLAPSSANILEIGEPIAEFVRWKAAATAAADLQRFFVRAAQSAASSLGVSLLPQPAETLTSGIFTKEAYRYTSSVQKMDYAHMNAEYGKVVLRHLIAQHHNLTTRMPRRKTPVGKMPTSATSSGT
jgi:hypothetical protein